MKDALWLLVAVIGLLVGANGLAWGMSVLVLWPNDGDYFLVIGVAVLLLCFPLVWYARRIADYVAMIGTIAYASTLVGIDSHLAFHKAFGTQQLGMKAGMTAIYIAFIIMVILRKNYYENPGK